jgi:tetratricopeptide (TPR) repeat protein
MPFGRRLSGAALAFLLVYGSTGTLFAQGGLDRSILYLVKGEVRDEFGDPIRGATITALNEDHGTSFTGTTDSKGRFAMIGLRPGLWKMVAQAPGHSPSMGEQRLRSANNPVLLFTLQNRGPRPDGPLANVSAKSLQSDLAAANQLFDTGQWDRAIAAYRDIQHQSPSLTAISLQIAAAYRNRQLTAEAEAAYKSLLASEPSNERARAELAAMALDRNDVEGAEAFLAGAAEAEAPGREVLFALGEVKARQGDLNAATRLFERASGADPGWGRPIYKLGTLAAQRGDRDSAAQLLQRVLSVDPQSEEATSARSLMDQLK